jgi:outer membrane protein OmpA-like peptidoglycan-associated protein
MTDRRFRARYSHAARLRRPLALLALAATLTTAALAQPTSTIPHPETPAPPREIRPLVFGASLFPVLTRTDAAFPVAASGDDCGSYAPSTRFVFSFPEIFALWSTPWYRGTWLSARASFRSLDAHLVSNETDRPFENRFENSLDTAVMVTRYDLERSGFELGFGAAYSPVDRILLGVGATLLFSGTASATQTDSIVSPREARFSNDSWTRPFGQGPDVSFNPVVLGVELTAQARLPMGERLALYPGLRGAVTLTPMASNVPWRIWSAGLTLGIGYDVAPRPVLDTAKPIVAVRPPPARRPFLKATITAVGIDEEGREYPDPIIEIEETPWVEHVPLLPFVFFDSAATAIAPRYARLGGLAESRAFSVDSLLDIDPIDVHWQVLNVIGGRLRANPAVTGTLIGTGSGDESPGAGRGLWRSRAEAIRRYLTVVWGIDSTRLAVTTTAAPLVPSGEDTPEGRAENRRVEFTFSDPSILDAVTVRRLASIASPPAVRFSQQIIADSAIAEWKISVVQGEKELLRFDGSSDEQTLKQDKLWSLADLRINRDLSEIRYRLDVRDVTGQTTAADGRFRVVERARRTPQDSLGASPTIVEHFLVGFNYNSAELLPQHRQRLEEIAQTITPDDELLLVGYTDRVGAQERNRQLSLERARVAFAALLERHRARLPEEAAITVRGYGPQEELFDNALPEGRMFSRMVRVVVTSYRDE